MIQSDAGPGAAGRPALDVRDLWVTFPGRPGGGPIHVLERVDLDVRRGEFVCIVGPSGCGKTTLLNVIGGFLAPTRGRALVEGEAVRGPDPRRIFIFQEGGVFPGLHTTVWDIPVTSRFHETKFIGTLLKGVFNFSSSTTALQLAGYIAYLLPVLYFFRRKPAAKPAAPTPAPTLVKADAA